MHRLRSYCDLGAVGIFTDDDNNDDNQ